MKYSDDTIKRYNEKAVACVTEARANIDNIHVHISYGNRKIGKTLNVNLPAVLTCGKMCHLCGCCKYCYAIKDALRFPAVMRARCENYALLLDKPITYWREIREAIKKHPSYKYIRFHVSGEIKDTEYIWHMAKVAEEFPDRTFWTYTKQYDIINWYINRIGALPSNLVVMFSDWDGYPMRNPYKLPTFKFVPAEKEMPKDTFVCVGNCDYCKAHKCGCVGGQSAVVHEH